MARSPSSGRRDAGRGARHRHLLRHAAHRAGRHLRGGGLHQHRLPAGGATSCSSTPRATLGCARRGTTRRRVHARGAECLADCDRAVRAGQPPLRGTQTPESFDRARRDLRGTGAAARHRSHDDPEPRHPGPGGRRGGGSAAAARPSEPRRRAGARPARGVTLAKSAAARATPAAERSLMAITDAPDRHRAPRLRRLAHARALPRHRRLRRACARRSP
jgi:hypothetical protein